MAGKARVIMASSCILLAGFIATAQVSFAQSNDAPNAADDPETDQWQDWQVTLTTKRVNHYLNYPTSKIGSLVIVNVQYAQPVNSRKIPAKQYENLYYSGDSEKTLGCKLLNELNITPGTAGTIKVGSANPEDSFAIANAVLRLYLDVSLNRCMVKSVVVPGILVPGVTSAICRQGFHRANLGGGGTPSRISLRVVSEQDQSSQIYKMY